MGHSPLRTIYHSPMGSQGAQILHIPMQLRRRGGRKVIITPDGGVGAPETEPAMPDDPVVRALVKARRWQTMLESGEASTIKDLAAKEGGGAILPGPHPAPQRLGPGHRGKGVGWRLPRHHQPGKPADGHSPGLGGAGAAVWGETLFWRNLVGCPRNSGISRKVQGGSFTAYRESPR